MFRRRLRLGIVICCLSVASSSSMRASAAQPAQDAAAAKAGSSAKAASQKAAVERSDQNPFGFSCDNQTTYTLATYCPQMAKAGIKWIRGFPTFNVVEPKEGTFDWTSVDTIIATAAKNDMVISGLFLYNAPWIKTDETTLPVNNIPAWSAYVSAVVAHSKASVKYWEVWNEAPNFIGKGTPTDYAKTVIAAHDAAKRADPTCQVGLSIQSNNVNWIEQVIKACARRITSTLLPCTRMKRWVPSWLTAGRGSS